MTSFKNKEAPKQWQFKIVPKVSNQMYTIKPWERTVKVRTKYKSHDWRVTGFKAYKKKNLDNIELFQLNLLFIVMNT